MVFNTDIWKSDICSLTKHPHHHGEQIIKGKVSGRSLLDLPLEIVCMILEHVSLRACCIFWRWIYRYANTVYRFYHSKICPTSAWPADTLRLLRKIFYIAPYVSTRQIPKNSSLGFNLFAMLSIRFWNMSDTWSSGQVKRTLTGE